MDSAFSSKAFDQFFVSESCRDLLEKMMSVNPRERPTIQEILNHPWFTEDVPENLAETVYLEMEARTSFMNDAKKEASLFPLEDDI